MPSPFDVAVVGASLGSAPHFAALADLCDAYPLTWDCARDAQRQHDVLQDERVGAALLISQPAP